MWPTLVGPGVVGSWLGISGGLGSCLPGPSGRPRGLRARLPDGSLRAWQPELLGACNGPALVCCRIPDTPQNLPHDHLLIQNGLGQPGVVGVCIGALDRDRSGIIHHTGPVPHLVLPPLPPSWQGLIGAWREAGIRVTVDCDPLPARWEKCILNATVGPLCLIEDCSMREAWRRHRAWVLEASAEGAAIAAAAGIALPPGLIDRAETFFASVGQHRPSVLDDPRELEWILDPLLSTADERGLDVPALGAIAQGLVSRGLPSRRAAPLGIRH